MAGRSGMCSGMAVRCRSTSCANRSAPRPVDGESMTYDRNNIFARILRGQIPCTKVYEDEHVLAFRDIEPQAPSHVVLVPKGGCASADDFSATASGAQLVAFMRAISKIAKSEGISDGGYRIVSNHG